VQRGLMIFLEGLQSRHNSSRCINGKEVDGKLYGVVERGRGWCAYKFGPLRGMWWVDSQEVYVVGVLEGLERVMALGGSAVGV